MSICEYRVINCRYGEGSGWREKLEKELNKHSKEGFRTKHYGDAGSAITVIMERQIPTTVENENLGLVAIRDLIESRLVELDVLAGKK